MSSRGTQLVFETFSPIVVAAYLVGVIAATMFCIEPACAAISLLGALAASLACRGAEKTLLGLRWQLPLLLLVCVINPIYSHLGSTVVLRVGPVVVMAESLAFGACLGAMLVAVVMWFGCAQAMMAPDAVYSLGLRRLPAVATTLSIVSQLVPQLLRRARMVRAVRGSCRVSAVGPAPAGDAGGQASAADASRKARGGSSISGVRSAANLSTTLLTWALEDSVGRADAMRARGWTGAGDRTSFSPRGFVLADGIALAVVVALAAIAIAFGLRADARFSFYPTMTGLSPWAWYVPLALLVALPTVVRAVDEARWSR